MLIIEDTSPLPPPPPADKPEFTIRGTIGKDALQDTGGGGADVIQGFGGGDIILGGGGTDTIQGGGDDTLRGRTVTTSSRGGAAASSTAGRAEARSRVASGGTQRSSNLARHVSWNLQPRPMASLAFYSDPLIWSTISSSTPPSTPDSVARKVTPAVVAISLGRGEVGRDKSSR